MRLRITIAMLEIRNKKILQSKVNICKSDVKIGDYADSLVVRRLKDHMCTNNLYNPLQSAYRSQHSTETAILKIHNNIIEGLDAGKCTVLSSLDLSAAFDTVDHTICIRRLNYLYFVDGTIV